MTPHGAAIRAIRDARRLSLRQLAAAAGIAWTYLAQIERGEKQPRDEVIAGIARALQVPVDAITQEEFMTTVTEADEGILLYPIKIAARKLGISPSWLTKAVAARAVEYTLFDPLKTGKGRALFSDEQLHKMIADSVCRPLTGSNAT
ncbi:helix-turn-helix domain-containing protein [Streptacidiphilus sp. EB103A]|uniref:helix-turn-helix domain-containing protein n=1 Tax=Streptacidiphilus sp. EB103A TaxID=3156275 RepID=UPI003519CF50